LRRIFTLGLFLFPSLFASDSPTLLSYNNPGLTVDLGVGLWAWPLPMDYDGDGDLDLVVSSGGKPYQGTYFFENPSPPGDPVKMPVFKPGVRVADYRRNVQISQIPGGWKVLTPGEEHPEFLKVGFQSPTELGIDQTEVHQAEGRLRARQWKLVDWEGDGDLDLVIGIGDWTDYGWDDAFNEKGEWTQGPLHGWVYLVENEGDDANPRWTASRKLEAGEEPIDVFGMPSPNVADFDGDGDLDLICGEFLDRFNYFENVGSREQPRFAAGRFLSYDGLVLRMDLQMITPTSVDWDGDGDVDLIAGDEDGRVAFVENTGKVSDGLPSFLPPRYFQQEADRLKFGALATPVGFDWDGDGDEDLISGNTAGYLGFMENLDGGDPPKWAAPVLLEAAGAPIRIQAGPNGSIQGPAEAKWGYTTLSVADWDADGLPDLVVNSIWGRVVWHRNLGTRRRPRLAEAKPIEASSDATPKPAWNWWSPKPGEFVSQWRTTPVAVDWTGDELVDLVMLDHEGYLSLFQRVSRGGRLQLLPGQRVFRRKDSKSITAGAEPLRLNNGQAGKSGRRKLAVTDWNGDGRPDLLVNSVSVNLFENLGDNMFADRGPLTDIVLAGHTTSPTTVDWDGNGVRDLLIGTEDGFFYYLKNPRSKH